MIAGFESGTYKIASKPYIKCYRIFNRYPNVYRAFMIAGFESGTYKIAAKPYIKCYRIFNRYLNVIL